MPLQLQKKNKNVIFLLFYLLNRILRLTVYLAGDLVSLYKSFQRRTNANNVKCKPNNILAVLRTGWTDYEAFSRRKDCK